MSLITEILMHSPRLHWELRNIQHMHCITFLKSGEVWILKHIWSQGFWTRRCDSILSLALSVFNTVDLCLQSSQFWKVNIICSPPCRWSHLVLQTLFLLSIWHLQRKPVLLLYYANWNNESSQVPVWDISEHQNSPCQKGTNKRARGKKSPQGNPSWASFWKVVNGFTMFLALQMLFSCLSLRNFAVTGKLLQRKALFWVLN